MAWKEYNVTTRWQDNNGSYENYAQFLFSGGANRSFSVINGPFPGDPGWDGENVITVDCVTEEEVLQAMLDMEAGAVAGNETPSITVDETSVVDYEMPPG